jgi:hypothetical protein
VATELEFVIIEWTVFFQVDRDVEITMSRSSLYKDIVEALLVLERSIKGGARDSYLYGSRSPSLLQPSCEVTTKNSSIPLSSSYISVIDSSVAKCK